jgi:hypothetical protein
LIEIGKVTSVGRPAAALRSFQVSRMRRSSLSGKDERHSGGRPRSAMIAALSRLPMAP